MDIEIRHSDILPDSRSSATGHLQNAIDRCAGEGGGTVRVNSGVYPCGTIRLRSNVCLHLEHGAMILGVVDSDLYPVIDKQATPDKPPLRSLLLAEGCSRTAITGTGIIDGGGVDVGEWQKPHTMKLRAALCFLRDCTDLRIEGVTLRNSLFWTMHLLRCTDVHIRGIGIRCRNKIPNTDGIDPDGCRNVVIGDCSINTDDDCIVVKSTEGDVAENITVTNCVLSSGASGLKVGTETKADIHRIAVSNCVIHDSNMGITLFSKDGGTLQKMTFTGVHMVVRGPFPLLLDTMPRSTEASPPGAIQDITLRDITVSGSGRCIMEGFEGVPLRNIVVENLLWEVTGAFDQKRIHKPAGSSFVSGDMKKICSYAEPYHFFLTHAEKPTMRNVEVRPVPGFFLDRKMMKLSKVVKPDLDVAGGD